MINRHGVVPKCAQDVILLNLADESSFLSIGLPNLLSKLN